MLISKDVWDLVSVGPRSIVNEGALWDHRRKEDRMAIGIATEIIQGGVSDDLFNNIIDESHVGETQGRMLASRAWRRILDPPGAPHVPQNQQAQRIREARDQYLRRSQIPSQTIKSSSCGKIDRFIHI